MHSLTVDLVTFSPQREAFILVLVETGPWPDDVVLSQLRRLQDRLYSVVDAAIDGHIAYKFPASKGKSVVVRVDSYDLPESTVAPLLQSFEAFVSESAEYRDAVQASEFIAGLSFEFHFRSLDNLS